MADYSFIRLAATKESAHNLNESPEVKHNYFGQIHLKPLDPQPYWQVTNSQYGMLVGTYSVDLVDECGNETDVTANVLLTSTTINGVNQLIIRLAYLPEMGSKLVYLKIDRYNTGAKFYYSNKFIVTAEGIEYTSRIDYVERNRQIIPVKDFYQSIRLQFYKQNFVSKTEIATYYQITTGVNVNPRALEKELVEFKTQPFDGWTYKRLIRALLGICYINQERAYLFESPEYNKRELESNISENNFLCDVNDNDFKVIAEVIIGATMIDFRTNVPNIKINDANNHLVTQIEIPT